MAAEPPAAEGRRWTRSVFTVGCDTLLVVLLLSGVSPLLGLDHWRLGMLLTHPPRLIVGSVAVVLAAGCLWRRRLLRSALSASAAVAAFCFVGWGLGGHPPAIDSLTLLSMNVEQRTENVEDLARLLSENGVDFLCLQEVSPENRRSFVEALPAFRFAWADETVASRRPKKVAYSLLIGVRADLTGGPLTVETAITGYRTIAARVRIRGATLGLVNVHTTKPLGSRGGLWASIVNAPAKAATHYREGDLLRRWLEGKDSEPVILAGDFNSPYFSRNVRLRGLHHAHLSAGAGPHLTYPRRLPLIGIDHVLGNDRIRFFSCRTVDAGFSDHRAQLVRFGLSP